MNNDNTGGNMADSRVPFDVAVAFVFGSDVPDWVGSAAGDPVCDRPCDGCPDSAWCWWVCRDSSVDDISPDWSVA